MKIYFLSIAALCASFATMASGADVIRHKIPNSDFPVAQAVEIPAGQTLVFLSGQGADFADKNAAKDSIAAYGDTKAQALNTLTKIEATLKSMDLSMKDVVK